jgi:hypothetical protein
VIERKDVELAHNSLKKWVPELRLFLELYRAGSSAFVHDGHDRKTQRSHAVGREEDILSARWRTEHITNTGR